jgi:hypothetical protein
MKYLFLLLLSILAFQFSFAGGTKKHSDNYVIMKDNGDTVMMFGEVKKDGMFIHFKDDKGKSVTLAHTKITRMVVGDELYLTLAISKSMDRLQRVVATSKDYILTELDENQQSYLYIWDKNFVNKESKLYATVVTSTSGPTKYGKKLVNTIAKYFGDCKGLMDKLNENLNSTAYLLHGISNYQCGE